MRGACFQRAPMSMALGPESVALLWAACFYVAKEALPQRCGRNFLGGMERWREVWSVPTQLVLLPLLYALGAETCFTYIFFLYMFLDLFWGGRLDPLIYLHHYCCLLGHGIVSLYVPAGFLTYFKGVVALELGSGLMNVYLLRHTSSACLALFAAGMTASNLAACAVTWEWANLPLSLAPKALCFAIAATMTLLRQQACYEYVRYGPPELRAPVPAVEIPMTPTKAEVLQAPSPQSVVPKSPWLAKHAYPVSEEIREGTRRRM